MEVIPSNPLPFGNIEGNGSPLDVHDDLKREVAFYNVASEAVRHARDEFQKFNVPFTRPHDFFAEMLKSNGTSFPILCCAPLYLFVNRQITWHKSKTVSFSNPRK